MSRKIELALRLLVCLTAALGAGCGAASNQAIRDYSYSLATVPSVRIPLSVADDKTQRKASLGDGLLVNLSKVRRGTPDSADLKVETAWGAYRFNRIHAGQFLWARGVSGAIYRLDVSTVCADERRLELVATVPQARAPGSNATDSVAQTYPRSLSAPGSLPAPPRAPGSPYVAENGSYYGEPNAWGAPKTVPVNGYYRKDGTYVRSHYRSPPRR